MSLTKTIRRRAFRPQNDAMTKNSGQIIDLYWRRAHAWTKKRASRSGRLMEAPWLDRFLGLLPSRPAVLDIGCGSDEPMAAMWPASWQAH